MRTPVYVCLDEKSTFCVLEGDVQGASRRIGRGGDGRGLVGEYHPERKKNDLNHKISSNLECLDKVSTWAVGRRGHCDHTTETGK